MQCNVVSCKFVEACLEYGSFQTKNCYLRSSIHFLLNTFHVRSKKILCHFSLACPGSSAGSQCIAWRWNGKHGHFHRCSKHRRRRCPKPCPQSHSGEPFLPRHPGCTTPGIFCSLAKTLKLPSFFTNFSFSYVY